MMVRPATLAVGLALLGGPALAAAPLAAQGCLGCHGPGGIGAPPIPPLAGRPAAETVAAMAAFRAGTRPGTIMPRIARGYTEAEMAEVAAYFSAQPAGGSR
jgi:cytochrome c553